MSTPADSQDGHSFQALVSVMRQLLAPDGCPWDREQTLQTLEPFLVEETYEVLEVMSGADSAAHCEELGDLLMQIVFQAELRSANNEFAIDDVVQGIVDKLVRRHPHVFANASADTTDEVLEQWEEIKKREKADKGPASLLDGIPVGLPPLARAQKFAAKAARVGFDWPTAEGCRNKLSEELRELDHAMDAHDRSAIEHELGDVLFTVVNFARKLGCDADQCLRRANNRFRDRISFMENQLASQNTTLEASSPETLEALWSQAKDEG